MFTAYEIKMILHYHSTCSVFPGCDQPLYENTVGRFINDGILEVHPDDGIERERDRHGRTFTTTARGTALVRMWKETPYPRREFIDPRTNKPVGEQADESK